MNKREFLKLSALASAASITGAGMAKTVEPTKPALQNITKGMSAISVDERKQRIAKAQSLMKQNNIDAIILEPGAAMVYFSGIQWWRSERLTCVVIPKKGDIAVVTPFFEEPSVRESLVLGDDVRPWHEHENPFKLVNDVLADRGIQHGVIGLEATVRYFVHAGISEVNSKLSIVPADPITLGCRMIKSQHELQLMRKANEVTLKAYEHVWQKLELGMTPSDVKRLMSDAQAQLGGSKIWGLALLNEASAYPHGSNQPQEIKNGSIVLMDCGCQVHGYQSDISRTFVFGSPSKKQQKVWNDVRQGQQVAFENAKLGRAAGTVDDAVRRLYESKGYGPGYKTPGLSHRTGHGIGMEGHEKINFVKGEKTPLAAGMCFSNEPGIYIFGEFGVRLEDCIYMTDKGAEWFTVPPKSIEQPIGYLGPEIA
ncbi:MAG: Xaa-Pro peptidase family protein [Kangiellaceae bacterium]|jgi:Xaa-Pro dipeptidase|nr:Xaa-Pro peptidase family protein [Kangiellaceae bacterium]